MWPPAKIMTISTEPMANGAMPTPAQPNMAVVTTVNIKKNVPMNSTTYFTMTSFQVKSKRNQNEPGTTLRNHHEHAMKDSPGVAA